MSLCLTGRFVSGLNQCMINCVPSDDLGQPEHQLSLVCSQWMALDLYVFFFFRADSEDPGQIAIIFQTRFDPVTWLINNVCGQRRLRSDSLLLSTDSYDLEDERNVVSDRFLRVDSHNLKYLQEK